MELTGKIIFVGEARSGVARSTGNPWMSQDYVLETAEQYPRRMMFNVFGEDKIKQFNLSVGAEVTVQFDINAREFNGRWYNDIRAWRIDPAAPAAAPAAMPAAQQFPPASAAAPAAPAAPAQDFGAAADSTDDLPF